jgi:hypothetical protein
MVKKKRFIIIIGFCLLEILCKVLNSLTTTTEKIKYEIDHSLEDRLLWNAINNVADGMIYFNNNPAVYTAIPSTVL